MIDLLLAGLLAVSALQTAPAGGDVADSVETARSRQPTNGNGSGRGDSDGAADDAAAPVEVVTGAEEPEEEQVCRRIVEYDDYGRRRTRRSCRPR